jgi:hypothetical protein
MEQGGGAAEAHLVCILLGWSKMIFNSFTNVFISLENISTL